ncbi:hypothetical protein BHM03_00012739 [Ensete ventricosum]|nr:hypothetical protein BHM03_00012739 [Ensete ventricosum]
MPKAIARCNFFIEGQVNWQSHSVHLSCTTNHLRICWEIPIDRVPNIKFNVAKVLQSLVPIVDQSVSSRSMWWWRQQSVRVWLSSVRIQMWMSDTLQAKHYRRATRLWYQARIAI